MTTSSRIKDLEQTAQKYKADDYIAIDGNLEGTRKILVTDLYKERFEKIESVVKNKIFKPTFGMNTYWAYVNASNSQSIGGNNVARMKEQIDFWETSHIRDIAVPLQCSRYNNTIYCAMDFDKLMEVDTYASDKGVKITALKIYLQQFSYTNDINAMTVDVFKSEYKKMINKVINLAKSMCHVDTISILNEANSVLKDASYTPFIKECLQLIKSNGFKAGISHAGIYNAVGVPDEVHSACDVINLNEYIAISAKGINTTIEDGIKGFQGSNLLGKISYLINKFPDKEFIISECGCQDYAPALLYPSAWSWGTSETHEGRIQNIYLIGLMEYFKNCTTISKVYWWYGFEDEVLKETAIKYLGGNE